MPFTFAFFYFFSHFKDFKLYSTANEVTEGLTAEEVEILFICIYIN